MPLPKPNSLLALTALVGLASAAQGQALPPQVAPSGNTTGYGIVSTIFMRHTNGTTVRVADGAGHVSDAAMAKSVGALLASDNQIAKRQGSPDTTVMTFFTPAGANRPTHAFACWAASDMPGQPRHHAQLQNFVQGQPATVDVNYANGVCADLDLRSLQPLNRLVTPAAPLVVTPAGGQRYGYMPVQNN